MFAIMLQLVYIYCFVHHFKKMISSFGFHPRRAKHVTLSTNVTKINGNPIYEMEKPLQSFQRGIGGILGHSISE